MDVTGFPSYPNPFLGRQEDLATINRLLSDENCRLLTLVGPGGIGKTRLALEAMKRLPLRDGERVVYIPLQQLTAPELLATAIAEILGLQLQTGSDPEQQLLDHVRTRSFFLVLDNVEHLLNAIDILSRLLAVSPHLRVLTTSRERLNLIEEWVFEVPALAVPPTHSIAGMESFAAVQLFLWHARRTTGSFDVDPDKWESLSQICRLVGGIPLALEMAAGLVRVMSLPDLADGITGNFDMLRNSARNVEARHRSMRAVFEAMWELLSETDRDAFSQLSVFAGGFTVEAARHVAGADVSTLTSELVEEMENLRQAWRRHVANGNAAALGRSVRSLDYLYDLKGWYVQGLDLVTRAEVALRSIRASDPTVASALGRVMAVRARWLALVVDSEQALPIARESVSLLQRVDDREGLTLAMMALLVAADLRGVVHEYYDLFDEWLMQVRQNGDPWTLSVALHCMGWALRFLNNGRAKGLLTESLRLSELLGNYSSVCVRDNVLWFITVERGELDEAQDFSRRLLETATKINYRFGLLRAAYFLGIIANDLQCFDEAVLHFRRGLQIASDTGVTVEIASCLYRFGRIAYGTGRRERAVELISLASEYPIADILMHECEDYLARLRMELRDEDFEAASQRGRSQSLDAVVASILQHSDDGGGASGGSTDVQGQAVHPDLRDPLTSRELDVLNLIAEGKSNSEIAAVLVLGVSTVKKHINHIFDKVGVTSRAELIVKAQRLGLV